MAERLPGLIDPNLPPDQQPLLDTSNPSPVAHPPSGAASGPVHAGSGCRSGSGTVPDANGSPIPDGAGPPKAPAPKTAKPQTAKSPAAGPHRSQAGEESTVTPVLSANFRREMEIRRYPVLVYTLVPLTALVLQAWLPRVVGPYDWFDFPLVVTVYFALGRRNPIQGTVMGVAMGLFEDALSHHAIGLNGVAKCVVGFVAASVGVRVDVENHTVRLVLNFLAFFAFERSLCIHLSRSAGTGTGMAMVHRGVSRDWQLADCDGAVSAAGPSANQGDEQEDRE